MQHKGTSRSTSWQLLNLSILIIPAQLGRRGKMFWKKCLAFLLAILLSFSGIVSATCNGSLIPGDGETDATSIVFFGEAARSLQATAEEEPYISYIKLTLGNDTMVVDGEEVSVVPPLIAGGDTLLPIVDIAEALGAEIDFDDSTGEITIEIDGEVCEFDAPPNAESLALLDVQEVADILALDTLVDGDDIILTRPFQTKVLLVRMAPGKKLVNTFGALDIVADGNGQYVLKYDSVSQTRDAFDRIKALPDCQNIAPNYIASSCEMPFDGKSSGGAPYDGKPPSGSAPGEKQSSGTISGEKRSDDKQSGGKQSGGGAPDSGAPVLDIAPLGLPDSSWGTERIRANLMKDYLVENGKTNANLIVAVLDTGADSNHPHLAGRMVPGQNFSETHNYEPTWTVDGNSHGTHVSGTVVDCTPDNVKIMPVKVLDDGGSGYMTDVAEGIVWASDNGAKVINMSLRWMDFGDDPDWDWVQREACEYASGKGVAVVVAAGNEDMDAKYCSPARLESVITVAATDQGDRKAFFSNFGNAIDVAAPGVAILSSLPGGNYEYYDGTSMASPHVAAAVSMLKLDKPGLTPEDLRAALRATTVDLGQPGWDRVFGAGVVDFRVFLGFAKIPATELHILPDSLVLEYSYYSQRTFLEIEIYPFDAMDKSFTVTSSNENVAVYQDGFVVPKGVGEAVLTFRTASNLSSMVSVTVLESSDWLDCAADEYAGGSGTETDPYLIATPAQLAKLAFEVRINRNLYRAEHFKLIADIDLEGKYWSSICYVGTGGIWIWSDGFMGNFDGNNHAVSNMKIAVNKYNFFHDQGLFGQIGDMYDPDCQVVIQNLAVLDADIDFTGGFDMSIGILCGTANEATIKNCFTTGRVSGSGLIGSGDATIINCFSTADVFAAHPWQYVGGLLGALSNRINGKRGDIFTSYASGNVLSNEYDSGCFMAYADANQVVNSFSSGFASFGSGFAYEKGDGFIRKCYYLADNQRGIAVDMNPSTTDLTPKDISFFRDVTTYTNPDNWDSQYPWDFENVWAVDKNVNNGMPYLKSFPVSFFAATSAETPRIVVQPVDKTVMVGETTRLSLAANVGSGTLSYQWYENTQKTNSGGAAIDGATYAVFDTPVMTEGTSQYYYCVVTNTDNTAAGAKQAAAVSRAVAVRPGYPDSFLVGSDIFSTLEEAVAAVPEGGIISMRRDVALYETVVLFTSKVFTLDLGEHTLSNREYIECLLDVRAGFVAVENGSVTNTTGVASIIVSRGKLSIRDCEIIGYDDALYVYDSGFAVIASGHFLCTDDVSQDGCLTAYDAGRIILAPGSFADVLPWRNSPNATDVTVTEGEPETILLDTPVTVNITESYQTRYYKFTAPETGIYAFTSSDSDTDPCGWLYDSNYNLLVFDDDSAGYFNFYIAYALTAGQQAYIEAGCYGARVGSYTLTVMKAMPYSITYDAQGGSPSPPPQMEISGLWAYINYNLPIRLGHTFLGWNTEPSGNGIYYQRGNQVYSVSDLHLYAIWEWHEWGYYEISAPFSCDSGIQPFLPALEAYRDTRYELYRVWLTAGREVTVSMESSDFDSYLYIVDPDGNCFDWDDDSGGNLNAFVSFYVYNDGWYYIVASQYWGDRYGNYTLTVNATTVNATVFTVTFDANGGSVSTATMQTGADGKLSSLPVPTRSGHRFDGWFTAASGGTQITRDTVFTADATVHAHWTSTENGTLPPFAPTTPPTPTPDESIIEGTEPPLAPAPPLAEGWENPYSDVVDTDWFYDAVRFVTEGGLMNGTGDDKFSPGIAMSRAMLVTVLYRLEGSPAVSGTIPFSDTKSNQWYSNAILWASQNDIVTGYGNGTFGLNHPVTREQAMTILYRYAKAKGLDVNESADLPKFDDMGDISDWALEAMKWAVDAGIVEGRAGNRVAPGDTSNRAEVATIFKRYIENLPGEGAEPEE